MNSAELMVKCLASAGVRYVFGVPGEENADFLRALDKVSAPKLILTRHEQGAAFMAGIYGRLTGIPAVALSTLGPGATNLITGVADANLDNAPMIALTGQGAVTRLHKESHQIMDAVAMFQPVTKWCYSIQDPETIPEVVAKAVRLALSERPGAVHLELPEDIAGRLVEAAPLKARTATLPVAEPGQIAAAVALLESARRPVILVGNGCVRQGATEALRELCDQTGIGVVSTFMGKGCVDVESDYCLFTVGLGQRDIPNAALDDADLVVTVGFDMEEYAPAAWNPSGEHRILHLDARPAETDRLYQPVLEVVGGLSHSLRAMTRQLRSLHLAPFDTDNQQRVRAAMIAEIDNDEDRDTPDSIRPRRALYHARQALDADDILLSDVGAHKMWIARHYHCHEPNTCLIPNGFCSMGSALPGAIAASLACPERRVLAISGDAGFLMNAQEMETARRLDSNLVVMVWVDNAYGLIAWKQDDEFGDHTDLAFGNPDWEQLAGAFGWTYFSADSEASLPRTLQKALNTPGPAMLVIPIDYSENQRLSRRLESLDFDEAGLATQGAV